MVNVVFAAIWRADIQREVNLAGTPSASVGVTYCNLLPDNVNSR
jgi:hypothetical protein